MKKLFALLVVAGVVFFSCGNTPAEPEAVQEEATEQVEETPEVEAEEVAEEVAE